MRSLSILCSMTFILWNCVNKNSISASQDFKRATVIEFPTC